MTSFVDRSSINETLLTSLEEKYTGENITPEDIEKWVAKYEVKHPKTYYDDLQKDIEKLLNTPDPDFDNKFKALNLSPDEYINQRILFEWKNVNNNTIMSFLDKEKNLKLKQKKNVYSQIKKDKSSKVSWSDSNMVKELNTKKCSKLLEIKKKNPTTENEERYRKNCGEHIEEQRLAPFGGRKKTKKNQRRRQRKSVKRRSQNRSKKSIRHHRQRHKTRR